MLQVDDLSIIVDEGFQPHFRKTKAQRLVQINPVRGKRLLREFRGIDWPPASFPENH